MTDRELTQVADLMIDLLGERGAPEALERQAAGLDYVSGRPNVKRGLRRRLRDDASLARRLALRIRGAI